MRATRVIVGMATCAMVWVYFAVAAEQAPTPFTYQGQLKQGGVPVNGIADFEFHLWNAETGGTELANNSFVGVTLDNGLFTVQLAFDAGWFDGSPRYLEVHVAVPSGGALIPLAGRQPITAVPYALYALDAPSGGGNSLWSESGSDVYYDAGNVGIGATTPAHALQVLSDGQRAISGENAATSGAAHGVYGLSGGTGGRGVSGMATASSGTTYGVFGRSYSTGGRGVFGNASAASGNTHGVSGQSWSSTGRGVNGLASATSGVNYGVYGETASPDGFAGYFDGRGYFSDNVGISVTNPTAKLHLGGIPGADGIMFPDGTLQTTAATGGGGDSLWTESGSNIFYNTGNVSIGTESPLAPLHVTGSQTVTVRAQNTAVSGSGVGVGGNSVSTSGVGVSGQAGAYSGTTKGVRGEAFSPDGFGVWGRNEAESGNACGVYGETESEDGIGVYGYVPEIQGSGSPIAVYGKMDEWGGRAVYGEATTTGGVNYAVRGHTNSSTGYAAYFTGGRNYLEGNVGIGEANPTAKLHLGGTPGIDGLMFPDGTLQTTAAGAGGGGDGHSLDAVDGSPANAVFVDMNGDVDVLNDLRAGGELIAEGEVKLEDPTSGTYLASLTRNTSGHGQLVTYANGVSAASAVVGTDMEANGAGGLVLLSFDNTVGPAVKLDSVSNAGRATLARSTGFLMISETVVMHADAPEVDMPSTASGGGGIDLLNDNGARSLAFRGADLGVGASIKGFNSAGGTVFSLETGTSASILRLTDGSGTQRNQVELAVGATGGLFGAYNSAGQLTVGIDGEDSTDGAGRVTTQKLMVTGGDVVMKDGTNAESVHLYADDPLGTHDGASLYLRDGTAAGVALHANYNGTGFSRVISDVVEIRGGADLSEQFDVTSDRAAIEPGMVVAIDPDHPGKLNVADSPYDRKVAGIISGAGGVRPGMLMGQQGSVADGEHPVALTGRVWTWCDASNGAIQPGDMLTTSNNPGHAMQVTDHARSQGAIIGKAMTSLEMGKGLVLVLVSLQ